MHLFKVLFILIAFAEMNLLHPGLDASGGISVHAIMDNCHDALEHHEPTPTTAASNILIDNFCDEISSLTSEDADHNDSELPCKHCSHHGCQHVVLLSRFNLFNAFPISNDPSFFINKKAKVNLDTPTQPPRSA